MAQFITFIVFGIFWSNATPAEYGGCGIPIKEHKELYEKCKKEGTKFHWTTDEENKNNKDEENKNNKDEENKNNKDKKSKTKY